MTYTYFVYLMSNKKEGTLYVGVTNDVVRRANEHASGKVRGFTQKYNLKMLVWYETHSHIEDAITREKQLKKWNRNWKLQLIEKFNPDWKDLKDSVIL